MGRVGAGLLLFAAAVIWAEFSARADEKTADSKQGIHWHEEVMEAWKKAQADKRPLLVYVAMDGCAYCRKMERDTLSDPEIAKWIERGFIATKLNGPKDPTMAKRLKIEVYPTTVIISPDNKVLDSLAGYVAADQLTKCLETITAAREVSVASATTTDAGAAASAAK